MLEFLKKLLSMWVRRKINLADYPNPGVDYGTLGGWQKIAMDNILAACAAGEAAAAIPALTQGEFDAVITHIGMHFGSEDICKNIALKRQNMAAINLAIYAQAQAHKAELDTRIEAALSTLNDGTTEYKLKQIAKYMAANGKYKYGSNDPLALLGKGGMCGAYSMLFYKMATRLGIQAYICYGYASNGTYTGAHAWNKAELEGGARYYDITFYDSGRSSKWLGSRDGWGRACSLNDKAALQKRG